MRVTLQLTFHTFVSHLVYSMTFFNHLSPVGVTYIPVHGISGERVLIFQGHVTEQVAKRNFCWHQPRKGCWSCFYYLRPQVGTDGEFWQCFVGWKTPFWLRCPFFYMSKKKICVESKQWKKNGSRAKLYFAMYAMSYRPSGWFIWLFRFHCISKKSLTVFLYNELYPSCHSNKQSS